MCYPETSGLTDDGGEWICADESEPDRGGQWRAGENGAMSGLIMPGTFLFLDDLEQMPRI